MSEKRYFYQVKGNIYEVAEHFVGKMLKYCSDSNIEVNEIKQDEASYDDFFILNNEHFNNFVINCCKCRELARFLNCDIANVKFDIYKTFEAEGGEYLVLTDAEADLEVENLIKEDLQAFGASFIVSHVKNYANLSQKQVEVMEEALEKMQAKLCEGANPIVEALIDNMSRFVDDAVEADGRGHFLASYDGDEHETKNFFIYRINQFNRRLSMKSGSPPYIQQTGMSLNYGGYNEKFN